jgi:actin related protein 2/3 complex subunit 2
MILLEVQNRVLEEVINQRIASTKREAVDITLADFDGVTFHVTTNPQQRNIVTVSIHWRCIADMRPHGTDARVKAVYGPLVVSPEPGYDYSLQFDLDNLGDKKDTIAKNVALFKRNVVSAPFMKLFDTVTNHGNIPIITINYRDNEAMYLKCEGDRAIIVFSINFRDSDDIVLSKVFLQEFANARKTISNAPAVTYSQKEAPGELRGVSNVREGEDQGFVTFVLFNNHIQEARRQHTIDTVHLFRDYLHYHIKCSKAYMHTRMRLRTEALLLVLNRAKQKKANKEMKTISGRTFKKAA